MNNTRFLFNSPCVMRLNPMGSWVLAILAIAVCLVPAFGCSSTMPSIQYRAAAVHTYHFIVEDQGGKPLPDASVGVTLYDRSARVADTVENTGFDGNAQFCMRAAPDTLDVYQNAYESHCDYSVSKNGYLPEYGSIAIQYVITDLSTRGDKGLNEKSETVRLNTVGDLAGQDINVMRDTSVKNAVYRLIAAVHQEYAVKGVDMPAHAVSLTAESGMQYLSLQLNTPNIVNLDVLDDSGVVKTLFEVGGRKTLELIRDEVKQLAGIGGLEIHVTGAKKHFIDSHEDPKPVTGIYRVPMQLFGSVSPQAKDIEFLRGSAVSLGDVRMNF